MKKSLILGLGPDYNYPGTLEEWSRRNTYYASNHGAHLISRTLAELFNGEYLGNPADLDFENPSYGACFLALATHVHAHRNVTELVDAVKQLDLPTYALSLGIQDYVSFNPGEYHIHPSVRQLLEAVLHRSCCLGVRGPYTAEILCANGFLATRPVGCPSLFYPCRSNLKINRLSTGPRKPLVVFHRCLAVHASLPLIDDLPLLAQDWEDEPVFTRNLGNDLSLQERIRQHYQDAPNGERVLQLIKRNGIFHRRFEDWFREIGKHDFVFGTRLHGCVTAIIQGIPALLLVRDLRTREVAEFMGIPSLPVEEIGGKTVEQLYALADYENFNNIYTERFENFQDLLRRNGLPRLKVKKGGM